MLITIIGPNLHDQSKGTFHVHAAGCSDIANNARRDPAYRNGWTIEAATKFDAAEAVYPPNEFHYDETNHIDREPYDQDLYWYPCCSKLAAF